MVSGYGVDLSTVEMAVLAVLFLVAVVTGFGRELGRRFASGLFSKIPNYFSRNTTTSELNFLRNEDDYYQENHEKIKHLFYYDDDGNTVLKTPNEREFYIVDRNILLYIISRFFAAKSGEADTPRVTREEVQESVPLGGYGKQVVRNSYITVNQFLTDDSFGYKFVGQSGKDSEFELDETQLDEAIEWILEKEEYQP